MQPPSSRTLGALVEENAVRFARQAAVSFEGETISFAEFRQRTIAFAKGLRTLGVGPGNKVGILMGNRIEWLVANFAVQYLGATTVAINTWYTARELAYVLRHADVAVLIAVERYLKSDYGQMLAELQPWSGQFPLLESVVMLGAQVPAGCIASEQLLASGSGVPDEDILDALARVTEEDLAYILYTSGSTALPKGVTLQHKGLLGNTWDIGERLGFTAADTIYLPISLFWGFGCENMLLTCWTHGVHIVLQPQFDAREGLELIERYRCTAATATANIAHAMFFDDQGRRDLSSLVKGTASGSPPSKLDIFQRVLPRGCSAYGLTEAYGYAAVNAADDPIEKRAASDGRPLPGMDLRIFSPADDRELPVGEVGEIRLRGYVTPGYYKDEAATRASMDPNGFFKTGDLGLLDADGFLYFKGRIKEVLKCGGITITPVEVEGVLRTHPDVLEAYVTGLPDEVLGVSVAAVVVPRDGRSIEPEALISHCRSQLAAYKIPRRYVFTSVEGLPYTTTQKVHRMRLPSLFPAFD